jgi:hypothetical protein
MEMVQGEQSQLVYEPDILYRYNQLGLQINYSWLTIDYRYILRIILHKLVS